MLVGTGRLSCTATATTDEPHQDMPTRVPPPASSPTTSFNLHQTPAQQTTTPFTQSPNNQYSHGTEQDGARNVISRTSLPRPSRDPLSRQEPNAGQNKLKVQLKLSISRLRMVQQKDSAKVKQQRREMAQLIEVRCHVILVRCAFRCVSARQQRISRHDWILFRVTCIDILTGWQSTIGAQTRGEHNPHRHHHRATRDPRTLL